MKPALLALIFGASIWMILVASYAIYECGLEAQGLGPVSTFPFREELIQAFNSVFPTSVISLLYLLKTNKTSPLRRELFQLCLITFVLGTFLAFTAKQRAFPDPADPFFAEAIWWLPDPGIAAAAGRNGF